MRNVYLSRLARLAGPLLLVSVGTAALADDSLSIDLQSYRVTAGPDGTPRFEPAAKASPGDLLEYRAVYRNNSAAPLRGVLATLPIPKAGVAYVLGSARPVGVQATADGRSFAAVPLTRVVMAPADETQLQPVAARDYRALRWQQPELAAGETLTVSARVRILPAAAAAATATAASQPTTEGDNR